MGSTFFWPMDMDPLGLIRPYLLFLSSSVAMAEAMVAHQATLFVQELSLSKVMMESDCLQVVLALNSKVNCNTLYGNVLEETRHQASKFHFL